MEKRFEQLSPEFFDVKTLVTPPDYTLHMITVGGQRWYYHFEDDKPVFKQGVTSWIKSFLPTSPHLIKWIAKMGYEAAEAYKNQRGDYGTILHINTGRLTVEGEFDMDKFEDEWLPAYCMDEGLGTQFMLDNVDELKKDILSWAKFLIDVEWTPLAVEIPLKSESLQFASHIDHIGFMNVKEKGFHGEVYKTNGKYAKKGDPKETVKTFRRLAVVDIKGNRDNFFESNEVQLHAYKRLVEENFPDIKVEKLYNWSPKDWRSEPAYNLKDQTDGPNKDKLDLFCQLAEIEREKKPKTFTEVTGVVKLKGDNKLPVVWQDINLDDNIKTTTLEEMVVEQKKIQEQKIKEK